MMQLDEIVSNYLSKFTKLPFKGILIALGLSFIFAVVASLLIYRIVLPNVSQAIKTESGISQVIPKNDITLHPEGLKSIVARNIFNKTGEVPKEDMQDDKAAFKGGDQAIKSELPLKLKGIIYGGDLYHGTALIENLETKKQASYLVGDNVTRDAVLIEIHEDKVILQLAEHKEFLELNQQFLVKGKRLRRKAGGSAINTGNSAKYSEEGFERDGNSITMSADYRQKLLTSDFAKVLQDAKAEPVYEGGELNGFRLTRIRGDSVYEKGGLQDNDIVKEINGVSLVDTAQAIKLLNSLRNASGIEIGLNRGGQKVNVSIQVK